VVVEAEDDEEQRNPKEKKVVGVDAYFGNRMENIREVGDEKVVPFEGALLLGSLPWLETSSRV
jgi:hypothetical protein